MRLRADIPHLHINWRCCCLISCAEIDASWKTIFTLMPRTVCLSIKSRTGRQKVVRHRAHTRLHQNAGNANQDSSSVSSHGEIASHSKSLVLDDKKHRRANGTECCFINCNTRRVFLLSAALRKFFIAFFCVSTKAISISLFSRIYFS